MPMSMEKLSIAAPAKVNLHLMVKEKRPDGFHNLESLFLAVNFGDMLHFKPVLGENSAKITMLGGDFGIPMEKNIIFRALSLFRSKTGYEQGFEVKVEKRIPLGGGLGGGSSNAASTLLALNKFAGSVLNKKALLEMAVSLGSDVPFFIHQTSAAWVTGRGECIEPLEAPRCFLVLVNPGFPSCTADAFRLLAEKREKREESKEQRAKSKEQSSQRTTGDMSSGNCSLLSSLFSLGSNSFLEVFREPEKSIYSNIISELRELGAVYAGLSGAGSTCFGLFNEKPPAEKAAEILQEKWAFAVCTSP